jgi:hypothetical protein
VAFPAPEELPVIVAVRMSLSFPILLSAIPLYAIDYTRSEENRKPERAWFSDGGICSNFPVHFFDRTFPRWPTFGISLKGFHPDHSEPVWLPQRNDQGVQERWTRFSNLYGFLGSMLDTMQQWVDNSQCKLPGYRDRIVYVCLSDSEGGLNLQMPTPTVSALTERGRAAGKALVTKFVDGNGWDNHLWTRFRSSAAALEGTFKSLRTGLESPRLGELLDKPLADAPAYKWEREAQRVVAKERMKDLEELATKWSQGDETLAEGAPRPPSDLRVRPASL